MNSDEENTEADLVGLPLRHTSRGRDPLEEVASRFLEALRRGESLDLDCFIQQYPHLEAELREFLPVIAAMEGWKAAKEVEVSKTPLPEEFQISHLGDCRIIREIARGGMGVVFEAEQAPLGRRVAVKLLPWKFGEDSRWGNQFLDEARIAARLQHPNIVPVFDFGQQDRRFYYVMLLIEGVGFDHVISRLRADEQPVDIEQLIFDVRGPNFGAAHELPGMPNPPRLLRRNHWVQIVKLIAQVTSAIRYAHQQGVLHRDLKPGNLLLDRYGKCWVADFGLAVGRDPAWEADRGTTAGTLRYMAPEQLSGLVDEQTDLYALGATLYELCTLQPAIPESEPRSLLKAVLEQKIPPPRSLNSEIPAELEAIILKLMHPEPHKRYLRAEHVYRDLLRFLESASHSSANLWKRLTEWF